MVRYRASCIGVKLRLRRTIMNENVAARADLSEISQRAIVMRLNPSGGG